MAGDLRIGIHEMELKASSLAAAIALFAFSSESMKWN